MDRLPLQYLTSKQDHQKKDPMESVTSLSPAPSCRTSVCAKTAGGYRKRRRQTNEMTKTTWLHLLIVLGTIVYIRLCWYILGMSTQLAYSDTGYYSHLADNGPPHYQEHHQQQQQTTQAFRAFSETNHHELYQQIRIPANESIAICLKISDDNMILPEWLAYHYTMLPLRYLVVSNDPRSQTSPLEVLERWNNTTKYTDLHYWMWDDSEFMDEKALKNTKLLAARNDSVRADKGRLFVRQNKFMLRCNRHFKAMNVTWVAHIDTDEFIALNRVTKRDQHLWNAKQTNVQNTPSTLFRNATWKEAMQIRHAIHPSNPAEDVTVYDAIQKLQRRMMRYPNCLPMARWRHGSLEDMSCHDTTSTIASSSSSSTKTKTTTTTTTTTIDTSRLETFRYVQAADPDYFLHNQWAKAIVDVSQLGTRMLKAVNPHRPAVACPKPDVPYTESILVTYHYTGSWERYGFRQDARRSKEDWNERGSLNDTTSCDKQIQTWLPKFVALVGSESLASYLLLGHSKD
jgi:hypothetical protein